MTDEQIDPRENEEDLEGHGMTQGPLRRDDEDEVEGHGMTQGPLRRDDEAEFEEHKWG